MCSRLKLPAALFVLLLASVCYEARGATDPRYAVWRIDTGVKVGTAFLVDRRGYFLTAAHTVQGLAPGTQVTLRLASLSGDDQVEVSGQVVEIPGAPGEARRTTLCESYNSSVGCTKGADLALVRATRFSELYAPLSVKLDFDPSATFAGEIMGYPERTSSYLAVPGSFALTDASRKFHAYFPDRLSFYVASASSGPGHSGSPVVERESGKTQVRAIMAWIDHDFVEGVSTLSFGTPGWAAYDLMILIPQTEQVIRLASAMRDHSMLTEHFKDVLGQLTDLEIVQLARLAGQEGENRIGSNYVAAIFDQCYRRRLQKETRELGPKVRDLGVTAWIRETARASWELALAADRSGDESAFRLLGVEAVTLKMEFFEKAVAERGQSAWIGPDVIESSAFSLHQWNKMLGRDAESVAWLLVSYRNGDPSPAVAASVGDVMFHRGRFASAAALYSEAHGKGLKTDWTTRGFYDSLSNVSEDQARSLALDAPTKASAELIESDLRALTDELAYGDGRDILDLDLAPHQK